ncbi:MAG: hypothetical protein H6554_03990 [Chitinophagales bacterium]|nr:hypothetical protein [Chitinophagales bacterium]
MIVQILLPQQVRYLRSQFGSFNINGYTQIYVLIDDTGGIMMYNNTGLFTGLSNGNYSIYAFNVLDADVAALTVGFTVGAPITDF